MSEMDYWHAQSLTHSNKSAALVAWGIWAGLRIAQNGPRGATMSDIVERARDYVRNLGGPPEEYLVWQLADEIARLRDELGPLIAVCREFIDRWPTEQGIDNTIQRARAILLDHDLRSPAKQDLRRALEQSKE